MEALALTKKELREGGDRTHRSASVPIEPGNVNPRSVLRPLILVVRILTA
jgi:hypothetical protein